MNVLVSIIIPTYNRAHLLGETLDSVLAQTYWNWDCIVVDDGSCDHTQELMEFYCNKDSRFQFYHRPKNRQKGANACRNFGFKMSKGEYIQWFDSDDLMVPEFLKKKVKALEENEADFVISKSANFRDPDPENIIGKNEQYYRFEQYEITNFNYISHKIKWLTYDFLGKRAFIEGTLFNEKLASGQEHNFFCKLTTKFSKNFIIDEYLTRRRVHETSIRNTLNNNPLQKQKENKLLQLETWKEISCLVPHSDAEKYLLLKIINLNNRSFPSFNILSQMCCQMIKQKRSKLLFNYLMYKLLLFFTGRGHILRKNLLNSI
ncbi:MAG: glycosyltransferase family 2 protein [Fulvivirga sp.]